MTLLVRLNEDNSLLIHRSDALLCASMCTTNANCETYYYEASQCHEANASSLEGSVSNMPNIKDVYIELSIYTSKKGKNNKIARNLFEMYITSVDGQWVWGSWSTCSNTCGLGTRTRSATSCNGPFYAGMPCSGNGVETESCQGGLIINVPLR